MILMNDFSREPIELQLAQKEAIHRVLKSGWYVLGKEVDHFEEKWAQYCGVKYAIGVANGMDAIEISLRCAGVKSGDEVITTPVTAFATTLAIIRTGATPVLADIEENGGICPESIARCITNKTKAIVPVHLYGSPASIGQIVSICAKFNLALIEDCAQAHGAKYQNQSVGSFGLFGAWSFYPTKNLGTFGDGGCITTNDLQMASLARRLRNYGQSQRYHHPELGLNSRLDELHAAILTERLNYLNDFNNQRRAVAEKYIANIKNRKITLLKQTSLDKTSAYHLFPVLLQERQKFMEFMAERKVQTLIHYPIPIHKQESCKDLRRDPNGLKIAERFSERVVSIPCHPNLTSIEVDQVIEAVNDFN